MLHVTNGDAAATVIRRLGLPGEVLPWRDVLHDGPVPAFADDAELREIRARFLSDCGWADVAAALEELSVRDDRLRRALSSESVHLWFEPDLYDQLQLVQVLDVVARHSGPGTVSLIQADGFLAEAPPDRLLEWYAGRTEVGDVHLDAATDGWAAFRDPDPRGIARIGPEAGEPLPYLREALGRLVEEYPGATDGLARSERQALEALRDGFRTPAEAFRFSADREEWAYLGDASFERVLVRLGAGPSPLLKAAKGLRHAGHDSQEPDRSFWRRELALTRAGADVLAGRVDRGECLPFDHWIGGVHLQGEHPAWRRDAGGAIVRAT